MALIKVKLIENVLTPEQRHRVISRLTEAIVSIRGENMCPVTSVVIEECAAASRTADRRSAPAPCRLLLQARRSLHLRVGNELCLSSQVLASNSGAF